MACPDCGSEEKIIDSGLLYCKKCGLELDELIITTKGKSFRQDIEVPLLSFKIDPKQELFMLKFGLKTGKLDKNWESYLGFSIKGNTLTTELKDRAYDFILDSFEKNKAFLESKKEAYEKNWEKIGNKFFIELENLTNFVIEDDFNCFLSLIAKNGIHNSSENSIIVNSNLKDSNFEIARQLFFIHFRRYVKKFFKEGFFKEDEKLADITCLFSLLLSDNMKSCFSENKFSYDLLENDELKNSARKIADLWKNKTSFKEFMIESYKLLGITKTWISY